VHDVTLPPLHVGVIVPPDPAPPKIVQCKFGDEPHPAPAVTTAQLASAPPFTPSESFGCVVQLLPAAVADVPEGTAYGTLTWPPAPPPLLIVGHAPTAACEERIATPPPPPDPAPVAFAAGGLPGPPLTSITPVPEIDLQINTMPAPDSPPRPPELAPRTPGAPFMPRPSRPIPDAAIARW
jgi:hypothetical protein